MLYLFVSIHWESQWEMQHTSLAVAETKPDACLKVFPLECWGRCKALCALNVYQPAWMNYCLLLYSSISSSSSSLCLHAVIPLLVCVTWLTGRNLHMPSTLVLNPAVGSSSLMPCPPFCVQRWAELANLCELNAKPSEHQQWELPSLLRYLFLFVSISHQTNACAHKILRCAGFGIFLSPVKSILHKPLDCEDMHSPRKRANGVRDTDMPL